MSSRRRSSLDSVEQGPNGGCGGRRVSEGQLLGEDSQCILDDWSIQGFRLHFGVGCLIREFRRSDFEGLSLLIETNRLRLSQYLETDELIFRTGTDFVLGIHKWRREGGSLIGCCDTNTFENVQFLKLMIEVRGKPVGFLIAKCVRHSILLEYFIECSWEGCGVVSQAVFSLLHALPLVPWEGRIRDVRALIHPTNMRSARVLQILGFAQMSVDAVDFRAYKKAHGFQCFRLKVNKPGWLRRVRNLLFAHLQLRAATKISRSRAQRGISGREVFGAWIRSFCLAYSLCVSPTGWFTVKRRRGTTWEEVEKAEFGDLGEYLDSCGQALTPGTDYAAAFFQGVWVNSMGMRLVVRGLSVKTFCEDTDSCSLPKSLQNLECLTATDVRWGKWQVVWKDGGCVLWTDARRFVTWTRLDCDDQHRQSDTEVNLTQRVLELVGGKYSVSAIKKELTIDGNTVYLEPSRSTYGESLGVFVGVGQKCTLTWGDWTSAFDPQTPPTNLVWSHVNNSRNMVTWRRLTPLPATSSAPIIEAAAAVSANSESMQQISEVASFFLECGSVESALKKVQIDSHTLHASEQLYLLRQMALAHLNIDTFAATLPVKLSDLQGGWVSCSGVKVHVTDTAISFGPSFPALHLNFNEKGKWTLRGREATATSEDISSRRIAWLPSGTHWKRPDLHLPSLLPSPRAAGNSDFLLPYGRFGFYPTARYSVPSIPRDLRALAGVWVVRGSGACVRVTADGKSVYVRDSMYACEERYASALEVSAGAAADKSNCLLQAMGLVSEGLEVSSDSTKARIRWKTADLVTRKGKTITWVRNLLGKYMINLPEIPRGGDKRLHFIDPVVALGCVPLSGVFFRGLAWQSDCAHLYSSSSGSSMQQQQSDVFAGGGSAAAAANADAELQFRGVAADMKFL